jgi:hypothetical protein
MLLCRPYVIYRNDALGRYEWYVTRALLLNHRYNRHSCTRFTTQFHILPEFSCRILCLAGEQHERPSLVLFAGFRG